MSSQETPGSALALSLVGGVLMLVSGILPLIAILSGGYGYGYGYGGMMSGFGGMMGGFGGPFGFIGLIAGIVVVIGAIMLGSRPAEHSTWGTIIVAFSIISFFGMGGFFIGAILGITGGALALSWRPLQRA